MRKINLLVVLGLVVIMVVACSHSEYVTKKTDLNLIAERPTWAIGDTWTYQVWKTGYRTYFYTTEVVDDKATIPGSNEECYKTIYRWYYSLPPAKEEASFVEYYSKQTLEYLGKEENGRFTGPQISQYELKFPLKLGLKWSQSKPNFQPNMPPSEAAKISILYTVVSTEELKAPGSTLEAFKIHLGYLLPTHEIDRNYSDLWYSPTAKNFAKRMTYSFQRDGSRRVDIRDLIAFKLK
jgi:hypothetical protein